MTETSLSPEAGALETDTDTPSLADEPSPGDEPAAAAVAAPSPAASRQTHYCPTCHARYLKTADECATCHVPLVEEQPRDVSLFRPELDIPFVLAFALFVFGYDRLNGEAQSFGLIFLLVGFATLVTFRAIAYAEWLGRR